MGTCLKAKKSAKGKEPSWGSTLPQEASSRGVIWIAEVFQISAATYMIIYCLLKKKKDNVINLSHFNQETSTSYPWKILWKKIYISPWI